MKENNSLRLDSIDAKELKKVYKYSLKLRSIGNIFLLISLVCLGICLYFFKYYFCQYHSFARFKLIIALFSMSICSIAIMYTYKYCLNKNAFKFFLFNSIFCFYYFFPVFSFLITDDDIPVITQIGYTTRGILFFISLIIFFTIITIGIVPFLDDNSLILEKFSHNQLAIAVKKIKHKELFKDEDLPVKKQNYILNKICLILSFMFFIYLYIAKSSYTEMIYDLHQ